MKSLIYIIATTIFPFLLFTNISIAQVSSNMTLAATWDGNNTQTSGVFYNDIWGYVDLQGNEYAIVGSPNEVHFLDVTIPTTPVLVHEHTGGSTTLWRDFKTYKEYCYAVADQGNEGLLIFDMSPLPGGPPVLVNQITGDFTRAHNIFIDVPNGLAYIAGSNTVNGGLIVYDLNVSQTNPPVVYSSNLPGGYIHDVFVQDNIAYASHGNSGFYMHDFSNPSAPTFIDSRVTGGYNHSSWITGDGNYIIYAEEVPQGRPMGVLDISDIANNGIGLVTTFRDPLLAPASLDVTPHNPFIVGDYVIISYYEDGVQVFDISDPANPVKAAWYDTNPNNTSYSGTNSNWGVYPFFPSGTIIATDTEFGLFVLQSNLNLPTTCFDGIQNGTELGVDCGGYCKPCLPPPPAPVAEFNASPTTSCDGIVEFTDLSTESPTSWMWDFGDGNTSTQQNPTHTYSTLGTYTVELIATNAIGSGTITKVDYITIGSGNLPTVTDGTFCPPGTATLTATGTGNLNWYDSLGTFLFTGPTFTTPTLTQATTYFVENEDIGTVQNVGPQDNSFGGGGYHGGSAQYLLFTTSQEIVLKSVWADADVAGNRTIELLDANSNLINSLTVNVPAGQGRISINWTIPVGDYQLGGNNMNLFRNNANVAYPYSLNNVVEITTSTAGTGFYYYFYDWEVETIACTSAKVPVVATPLSLPTALFTSGTIGNTVSFNNLSTGGTSFLWTFGDGTTDSTNPNPQHTFAQGTYTTILSVTNSCGSDSFSETFTFNNNPPSTPTANFEADPLTSCSGVIDFTDLSTGGATGWLWDFGDGNSSSVQNPTHTYTNNGSYDITLIASNGNGSDTLTKVGYITITAGSSAPPVVTDDFFCPPGSANLTATGTGLINWYDSTGTLVNVGPTFNTPTLTTTTTYFVENENVATTHNVGPVDNSIGGGGYFNGDQGLIFNALQDFVLKSVWVDAGSNGNRDILLLDAATENQISATTVFIPAGQGRVSINLFIPAGNYILAGAATDLFRNNNGAPNYPYTVPGVVEIVGSTANNSTAFYYFYYDWEVETLACTSAQVPVTASASTGPVADFSVTTNGNDATFTDLSTFASFWNWDFGDGTTSNAQNPQHTFGNGTFIVTLNVTNSCGTASHLDTLFFAGPDNTPPTTVVTVPIPWVTDDFQASYDDNDNIGGSGLAERFYKVKRQENGEWRANKDNGFIYDNFDQGLHPDWNILSGQWAVNNGALIVNNLNGNNARIETDLNQNDEDGYLYHWQGNLFGSSPTQRAGLHFMATGTASGAGTSYGVYLYSDFDEINIYKADGNGNVLVHTEAYPVDINLFYDIKVVYMKTTGRIILYLDDVLSAEWTDPNPITSGDYIYYRVRTTNYAIDDLQVFKHRALDSTLVTTDGITEDIDQSNVDPNTPAGEVCSIVIDSVDLLSNISTAQVNLDLSPPLQVATVNDGPGPDIDTTTANVYDGNWTISSDPNSDIAKYWYSIGTAPGLDDVVSLTDNGLATTFSLPGSLFMDNVVYYITVYAENGAGLISISTSSDGLLFIRNLAIQPKVMLAGPYDLGTGQMKDALRVNGVIPMAQPYSAAPWAYTGTELTNASVLSISGQNAIVDWILIELRDKADSTNVLSTRAALLQADGDVVDVDGNSSVLFSGVSTDSYFIVIIHRNHLGIMTESPVFLQNGAANITDFISTLPTYGTNAQQPISGRFAMWPGDVNGDGAISASDRSLIWNDRNADPVYFNSDVSLDAKVDAADRSIGWNFRNRLAQLPKQ